MPTPVAAPDPLADLRRRFVARTQERLAELSGLVGAAEPEAAASDRLVRLAHQLAGSAGTFGCTELGRAAAALEDVARAVAASPASPPADRAGLEACLSRLQAAVEALSERAAPPALTR